MIGAGATPPRVASRIDELIAEAKVQTGLDDFGGDTWREGLEVLIRSAMTEATFSNMGEMGFYRTVLRSLTNRLKVEDWFRRRPDIDEQSVEIELVGGWPAPCRRDHRWPRQSDRQSGPGPRPRR